MANVIQKPIKSKFTFRRNVPNPNFALHTPDGVRVQMTKLPEIEEDFDKSVPLRSCLIHNNAEKFKKEFYIKKEPKWLTQLNKETVDCETGELEYSIHETDDLKQAHHRMIKTVNTFCDFYEDKYKKREVSVLFHTFTQANKSKLTMRDMIDIAKYRYSLINRVIRGYLWCLEVSANNHIHYHLVIVVDRIEVKKIPECLKFNDAWGRRTGVEFIKKTVKGYLTKYLTTTDKGETWSKVMGRRSYSISRKLK